MQVVPKSAYEKVDTEALDMNEETQISETETTTGLDIVSRINALHEQADSIAKSAKEQANRAVEIAVECGRLLSEQKKSVEYGKWVGWIKANCNFSEDTAQNYMRLYRKVAELTKLENETVSDVGSKTESARFLDKLKGKTIKQAYIATGILPEPIKPDNSDKILPLVVHVKHIDFIVKWYRNTVEQKPAKDWNPIEREALINDLTPLMEIYNELIDLQESAE